MDPVPPAPSVFTSSVVPLPEPKSKIWLWAGGGILLLGVGIVTGVLLGKQLYSRPAPQPTPSPSATSVQEGDLYREPTGSAATANQVPDGNLANWKTYTNTSLGFSFKYPPELEIQENISGPSEVSSDSKFTLTFKNALQDFQMGGITSNFGEGRGGMFTDTRGFLKMDNKLYCLSVGDTKFEIPNNLLKKIYSNDKNVEIVLMSGYTDPSNMSGELACNNPGSGYNGALINLRGEKFKGIGILFRRNSNVITEQIFDQILSTFKFTSN